MSSFYSSLPPVEKEMFRLRKQEFKKGKPCAICGKKLKDGEMMVAHLTPVRELSDYDAVRDTTNWEVRCIYCERRLNQEEDKERNRLRKEEERKNFGIQEISKPQPAPSKFIPAYERDVYEDHDKMTTALWEKTKAKLGSGKKRRSLYAYQIEQTVRKADKMTLAKATAKYIISNNEFPDKEAVFKQMMKDIEDKMVIAVGNNFKPEKEENTENE